MRGAAAGGEGGRTRGRPRGGCVCCDCWEHGPRRVKGYEGRCQEGEEAVPIGACGGRVHASNTGLKGEGMQRGRGNTDSGLHAAPAAGDAPSGAGGNLRTGAGAACRQGASRRHAPGRRHGERGQAPLRRRGTRTAQLQSGAGCARGRPAPAARAGAAAHTMTRGRSPQP